MDEFTKACIAAGLAAAALVSFGMWQFYQVTRF